jgi:hypothetical protein
MQERRWGELWALGEINSQFRDVPGHKPINFNDHRPDGEGHWEATVADAYKTPDAALRQAADAEQARSGNCALRGRDCSTKLR